ncbi:hypothetical protein ESZ54_03425 [Vagococcus silagei]|uniref:Isoprenylcysteine carboxylmethyltransferase family protein n=2 Tax=Vagococcus silagei TaxID=2508885 RepID=A0A4S3B7X8_9ENTE|nr:hypothetical protein ESZ54_03425 [Vagococcus silagei]
MYIGYFLIFLGCGLLYRSLLYLMICIIFQFTAHWMVNAEERWCQKQFGDTYLAYQNQVRKYI